jgi:hypothetical protein
MEQMMACLLSEMKAEIRTTGEEMKTNQAKMDANLKEMKEGMTARLEAKLGANNEMVVLLQGTFFSWLDAHQAKIEAHHEEWMATMKASQERMKAMVDIISLRMMEACLEKIGKNQGEVEMKMEADLEEAMVETIRALEDQYVDWQPAIWRCQQLKKRTQGNGGFQKKLAAASKWMICHTIPAQRKRNCHKGLTV